MYWSEMYHMIDAILVGLQPDSKWLAAIGTWTGACRLRLCDLFCHPKETEITVSSCLPVNTHAIMCSWKWLIDLFKFDAHFSMTCAILGYQYNRNGLVTTSVYPSTIQSTDLTKMTALITRLYSVHSKKTSINEERDFLRVNRLAARMCDQQWEWAPSNV